MEERIEAAVASEIDRTLWDPLIWQTACDRQVQGASVEAIYPEVERVLTLVETFATAGGDKELRLVRDLMMQEAADNPVEFTAKYALNLRTMIDRRGDGAQWKRLTRDLWESLESVGSRDFGNATQLYESLSYCF